MDLNKNSPKRESKRSLKISAKDTQVFDSKHLPKIAWSRKLSNQFPDIKEFSVSAKEVAQLAMLGFRMWKYVRREKTAGRIPIMDPFNPPPVQPLMGVPIGGIGCGSINRGWRGDFIRWNITPCGLSQISTVEADQFSVFVRHLPKNNSSSTSFNLKDSTDKKKSSAKNVKSNSDSYSTVLYPGKPKKSNRLAANWDWQLTGDECSYHALFPRAWTHYNNIVPNVHLTCRQISPVIPHNYKESSYPSGVFVWTIENENEEEKEISIMFTFQNGMGTSLDSLGGHSNSSFKKSINVENSTRNVQGIVLKHKMVQTTVIDGKTENFNDPLSFAIAALGDSEEVEITQCTTFETNNSKSLSLLWKQFSNNGTLRDFNEYNKISPKGISIGSAIAVKVIVSPKSSRQIVFSLAWDNPVARFSSGAAYFRRYTSFFGTDGNSAADIACDALANYKDWESQIEEWQNPIINDINLPDNYKCALFNELYYIVDGGTIWTTSSKTKLEEELSKSRQVGGNHSDPDIKIAHDISEDFEDIGHFGYLESLEYLMYNTYDVHFYASFALAMLWPRLELSLQRDIGLATIEQYKDKWEIMHTGKYAMRKVRGAVPHDMGNPGEDPWNKVNSYCIQDISRWKDLPCKFVLQVYRDYIATKSHRFVSDLWPIVKETIQYAKQFDTDNDGVLDNENYPDQTYDTWPAVGCSAYSGGLWLTSLSAAAEMAKIMGENDLAKEYTILLEKGKENYTEKLWNGTYYNYDSSNSTHHDSIMADQMAGQWYAKACGLSPIVPETNAYVSLQTVYHYNVKRFNGGTLGAINGMKPNGELDDTCMQSLEVWTGTTYGLAAAMLQQGLVTQAFETASGIINSTYEKFGYMFQTPEAWDVRGRYRSAAYMRPLAIWSIQWAWEKFYATKAESKVNLSLDSENWSEQDLDSTHLAKEETEPL